MEQFYIVTRFNINAETGKEAHSQERKDTETAGRKRYYNILAADIDNAAYSYELVQIVRSDGICIASQVFDNRQPEQEEEETYEAI